MPNGEPRIIGKNKRLLILLTGIFVFLSGLYIRYKLIWFQSRDWIYFWQPWMEEFRAHGLKALSGDYYDYAPTYMYVIWLASKFGSKSLPVLKLFSVGFDLVLSLAAGLVTYRLSKKNEMLAGIAACIVWISPTVTANSAMWGQCDSCYSALLLLALAAFLYDKSRLGMIFYGIAFAFKLQTVIWAPVIVLLWLYKKIRTQEFLYIPIFYFISIIPAWLAGRPLSQLLSVYFNQTGNYSEWLSMKYPNIYYLLGEKNLPDWYGSAGVFFSAALLLIFMVCIVYKLMDVRLTDEFLLLILLSSGMLFLYVMPHMHERYAFSLEAVAIIYGLTHLKRVYVPVLQILTTFITYSYYLCYEGERPVPYLVLAFINLFVLVTVCYDTLCYREKRN